MVNELMFQLAIEGPGKRLKEIKDQLDGWSKDMTIPIKLTADLTLLKQQLKDLGVVFGENRKELKQMANEVDQTISRVNKKIQETGSGSLKATNIDRLHRMMADLDVAIGKLENHKWLSGDNLKFSQYGAFYKQLEQLRELRNYIDNLQKDPNLGKRGWLSSLIWEGNGEQLMGGMTKKLFSTKTIDDALKQMDERMKAFVRQSENASRYAQQMQQALSGSKGGQREQWEIKRDADAIKGNYEALLNQLRHIQEIRSRMAKDDPDFMNLTALTAKLREFIGEYSRLMNNRKLLSDPTSAQKFGEYFSKVWNHISKITEAYDRLQKQQSKPVSQPTAAPIDMKSVNEAVYQVSRLEDKLSRLRELESKASSLGIDTSKIKNLITEMESYLTKFRQIIDNGGKSNGGLTAQMLKSEGEFRSFTARISENTRELGRNITEKNKGTSAESSYANAISHSTTELRNQSQVLGDLRTMAMQYLSVWGARTFLNNIIEQGGLLEQQRLSIGAILQDTAQANSLFSKIKGLAIKSPFGVTELDAMTKQLSAYGFQYSELYDWTKRLADISAATGTEVSRLALALGHVRSEGALSGYTLRQFSMGNIPMLSKLADKLGKTTAEIRKMVSKKEIGYDQVLEVFKELTDEGGMFYNAQETMAEALNAKFKNLRDSFQIMYSEMAEGAPGSFLKGVAETLTTLSKNWRVLMPMIAAGAGVLGLQKAVTMAVNHELAKEGVLTSKAAAEKAKYAAATNVAIAATGRWTLALRGAGRALLSLGKFLISPLTLGFAAVEGVIYMWQRHNQEVEKAKELTKGFANQSSEALKNIDVRLTDIAPYSDGMTESALKQGIETMTESLKNYAANSKEVMNTAFGEGADGKVKSLAEQYQYLRDQMEKTVDVYKEMKRTADAFEFGINYTDGGWFDDNVETDLTDYANAVKNYEDAFTTFTANNQLAVQKSLEAIKDIEPVFKSVSEELKSDAERVKWLYENQSRWGNLYESFKGQLRINGADYGGVLGYSTGATVESQRKEAERELDSFFVGIEERLKKFGYDFTNNGERLTEVQVGNLLKQSREWLDKHPEWQNIYNVIWGKLNQRWGLPITPEVEDIEKPLNEWQQQMQDWLDKRGSTIKIKPEMPRQAIIDMVHNSIKETQAAVDQTKPILLKFGADLSDLDDLPIGLQTPWGRKQARDYQAAAPQNKTARDFLTEFGLPQPKEKNKGNRKEDKQLKEARTRMEEAKSFLAEYKKYREVYGKERSISMLEDLFPNAKGKGKKIVEEYKSVLNDIKNSIKLNTEDRKKFGISIDKLIADTDFTEAKEKMDRQMKEMERFISEGLENYNLYQSLLQDTGSHDIAMSAFVNGQVWDDAATNLADTLREKMGDKGGLIDWEAEKQTAEDWFKKNFDNGEELYRLWEKITELISKNYIDGLKRSASAIKDNLSYSERIEAIRAKYTERNKTATNERERYANTRDENAEIAQVRLDELKDEINWDAVFGNLKAYTKDALVDTRKALSEYVRINRNSMNVQQLKDVQTAITNLDEAIADKSGLFSGLQENIAAYKKATEELTKAEKEYQETVKKYGAGSIQAQDAKKKVNQAQNNVQQTEANVKKSELTTMQKIAKISNSLVSIGRSNEASLGEVGNVVGSVIEALNTTGEGIGTLIAAIFSLLDAIGKQGLDRFLGNVLDNVGHAVGGIFKGVGNMFGTVFGDSHAFDFLDDIFGNGYKKYEAAKAEYDNLITVWDSLISKKKEYLNQKWGQEAQNAGAEALALMKAELEATKIVAEELLSAGASMGSRSIGYRMWQGSYSYNGQNWRDVAGEISRALGGVRFEDMSDMLNMTAEQLLWIKTNYAGLWAHMDGDFQDYLEKIITYSDETTEVINKMKEKLTGWNLDNLKSEWSDLMASMDNSSDKLAENLEEKLRNAIISSLIDNQFSKRLQALIDSASLNDEYINTNGQVSVHHKDSKGNFIDSDVASEFTQAEWEALIAQGKAISEEATAMRDMLKRLYGWSDSGSGSSVSGNIKGITEQTADLLASYTNSIRADLSAHRALFAQYAPMYYNALTTGNASLRNIENHTAAIMRSNDTIAEKITTLDSRINGLQTGAWRVPMK